MLDQGEKITVLKVKTSQGLGPGRSPVERVEGRNKITDPRAGPFSVVRATGPPWARRGLKVDSSRPPRGWRQKGLLNFRLLFHLEEKGMGQAVVKGTGVEGWGANLGSRLPGRCGAVG